MKIGRRLAIKILNASKFVLSRAGVQGLVTEAIDRAMLAPLALVIDDSTVAFEGFDYARALDATQVFFWGFCDDYLELVKSRAYGETGDTGTGSANAALVLALSNLLRLFAPFLPFVTEEAWSWWQGSIHRAAWPDASGLRALSEGTQGSLYGDARTVLGAVRRAKSDVKASLKTPVAQVIVTAPKGRIWRTAGGQCGPAGRLSRWGIDLVPRDRPDLGVVCVIDFASGP